MKINHRISRHIDDPIWFELEAAGVAVDRGSSTIAVANVTEDDPAWPRVQQILQADGRPDMIDNIFTDDELDAAEWLDVMALGHHGYPQPEKDLGYIEQTYDTATHCSECGIGGVQNNSFRLRAEPKARQSQFIQLNWVFDELFVRAAARKGLQSAGITGVSFMPAVLHKSGQASAEVMQMQVSHVLQPGLHTDELFQVTCKADNEEDATTTMQRHPNLPEPTYCGRVKYHRQNRGPLRIDCAAFKGAPDVVKSREWFGSGGNAFRLIMVSRKFRRLVRDANWRGLSFEPIELV